MSIANQLQVFCLAHYHEIGLAGGKLSNETHTINGLTALNGLKGEYKVLLYCLMVILKSCFAASGQRLSAWFTSQTNQLPGAKVPILPELPPDFNWRTHKGTQEYVETNST
jgi:hypothetical protein